MGVDVVVVIMVWGFGWFVEIGSGLDYWFIDMVLEGFWLYEGFVVEVGWE